MTERQEWEETKAVVGLAHAYHVEHLLELEPCDMLWTELSGERRMAGLQAAWEIERICRAVSAGRMPR